MKKYKELSDPPNLQIKDLIPMRSSGRIVG